MSKLGDSLKYKKKKLMYRWYMRLHNVPKLDPVKLIHFIIVSRSINKQGVELQCLPISENIPYGNEARYINIYKDSNYTTLNTQDRADNIDLFITIKENSVHIKNHTFQYFHEYHSYYIKRLNRIFDRKLLKVRKAMETSMDRTDMQTLSKLLDRINAMD